jgi:hypothetical protein
VIGLVVVGIIITVGPVTNASLNPARAIGPLFVTTIHGGVHNWLQQCLRLYSGEPDRRGGRMRRLRLDGDASQDRAPDRGSRN